MKMLSAAAILVGSTLVSSPSLAWNDFGHMEVAAFAWSKLDPTIQNRATALIKLNPMYQDWIKNVPDSDRDQVAFVRAATWPDAIKRSHDYHSDGSNGGDRPPPEPQASQNIGYADHFMHKYWHFVDIPFSPDGTALEQPPVPNAQTQIAALRKALSDPMSTDDLKSYDLVWLLHLVGDVHQPLHATSRFVAVLPNGDAGGNDIKIHCGSGCKATELHAFWDDVLSISDKPADAIAAAKNLPVPDASLSKVLDESIWVQESFNLAKKNAYKLPIGNGKGPFALTQAYKSNVLKVAKKQASLAGQRLANLLNAALK